MFLGGYNICCIVSSKEEYSAPENFVIDPVDLNSFFDDDGKIYGYEDLKVLIIIDKRLKYIYT